ncbi:MAG: FAD-dependent oxidoreductase [Alphaproteobacteria bacterium]
MLNFDHQTQWRTVKGGSRAYVERLTANAPVEVLNSNPVRQVLRRSRFALVRDARGTERPFDHVIIATHADQALALLGDPTPAEYSVLSNFNYQTDRTVLHRDPRLMPSRRKLWSTWNYLRREEGAETGVFVTYWMNRLQNLSTDTDLFQTLNPTLDISPGKTEATFDYQHLVLDADAVAARSLLPLLQSGDRTSFCGSYFGHGSHEDSVRSGLAAAEGFSGIKRPWTTNELLTGAPAQPPEAVSLVDQ